MHMASSSPLPVSVPPTSPARRVTAGRPSNSCFPARPTPVSLVTSKRSTTAVSAVGDVSSEGTTYLIAGAVAVALLGTAFPILFSRKDTCPECDGAGFVRKSGATLRANAARKDQSQIVCPTCNGLGKLGQIDK
ncbi:uncharacterized protein LOC131252847 [Magnolia sinica]|uniref:uncharacterized protein LOC131252847 n=1 Tax=Magnolia sinica TaxID=86752 RepID=UPI00265A47CB|nr:uncharacterized protein LOC131252847 [Magnolia sinica]